ncbi:MAG: ATP synthase F1 subunit epsilon [Polyangiaceae bacterium]
MATPEIRLEIVTPEGVALVEQVHDLTAPSVEGEFGVLPNHRPLLAALKTGIVSYHHSEGDEVKVAVGKGFVEVMDNHAILLTDRFIKKDDVDPVRARLDLKEADEELDKYGGEPDSPEYAELVDREVWAATQLELYGDPPPPTVRGAELGLAPSETFLEEGPHLAEAIVDEEAEVDDRHAEQDAKNK